MPDSWNMSPLELHRRKKHLERVLALAEKNGKHVEADNIRSRIVYLRSKYRDKTGKEMG